MASGHVLRIPRSDNEGEFVLVNVTSSVGTSALDLKLLATEGESPYILDLKHSRIQRYRAKAGQLDEAQWEALLYTKLLRQSEKEIVLGSEKDETLEVRAVITGEQMTIIFRKNISGITQRLGEISLVKDEAQEVDAVAWASTAVLRCDDLEKEVEGLKLKYEDQQSIIRDLQQQLEDLIEAKKMHETALLEKFRDLLNAKKLKIRDQQRVLIQSKGPRKADQPPTRRHELLPSNPTPSSPRKRKAKGTPSAASASSTGFDTDQSLEDTAVAQDREEPPLATPERSDPSLTEDEDDNDNDDEPKRNSALRAQDSSKPILQGLTSDPNANPAASPPPRRELPFLRPQASHHSPITSAASAKAEQASGNNGDDGDETSDDEL